MKIFLNKVKLLNIFLAQLYFCLLLFVYWVYVSDIYNYMGYVKNFSGISLFVSFISIFFFYFLIDSRGITSAYHNILLLLLFIPSMVIFSCADPSYIYFFSTFSGCLIVILVSKFIKIKSLKIFKIKENLLLNTLVFVSILYILSIFLQGGFNYFNLNILKVYQLREAAASNLPSIFGYISPIVSKCFVPFVIVIGLSKKRVTYVIIGFIFSILIFALTAHKSPLFYPFVILLVYWLYNRKFNYYIISGLLLVVIISIIDFYLKNSGNDFFGIFGSLFTRRTLMTPAKLNSYYIDFFSDNVFCFWASSKFSLGLVEQPYSLGPANLIGDVYFSRPEMSANTGFVGSGFANAGWFGIVLYSVIIGFLISFFSSCSKKIGEKEVFSLTFIIIFAIFSSTDLTTSLLTHGLGFIILFFILFPRKKIE
jgi:hypothetical protein